MIEVEKSGYGIRNILVSNSTVNAIVNDQVRPHNAAPNDSTSYIVYSFRDVPYKTKDGTNSLWRLLVTLELYTDTSDGLDILAAATRHALDGQNGTFGSVEFVSCDYMGKRDYYREAGKLDGIYMMEQDYELFVNAT